jgi:sugar lactone lactonase YvrE
MRLSRLFLIYLLSTAAAVATPFALYRIDYARRRMIPVGSGPALEAAPLVLPVSNSGNSTYALPACIAPDGTEYYGDRGYFYAYDQAGNKRYLTDDAWSSNFDSCAVRADGTVYLLADHNREGSLSAYMRSGKLEWTISLPQAFSSVALSSSGIAYFVARQQNGLNTLYASNTDGSPRWELPIGGNGGPQWVPASPAIGPGGTIYAISGDPVAPELIAVDTDGRRLWNAPLPARASQLIVGPDGRIFVHMPAGNVVAFDSRGKKLWEFHANNRNNEGGIALAPDGTLYFASNFVYALDAAGQTKWTFKSEFTYTRGDYFDKSPVVADDGTLYAVSYYQQLYALTPDGRTKWHLSGEPTNIRTCWDQISLTPEGTLIATAGRLQVSSGLAKTGWPSKNLNNSNGRSQEAPQ